MGFSLKLLMDQFIEGGDAFKSSDLELIPNKVKWHRNMRKVVRANHLLFWKSCHVIFCQSC